MSEPFYELIFYGQVANGMVMAWAHVLLAAKLRRSAASGLTPSHARASEVYAALFNFEKSRSEPAAQES